LKLHLKNQLDGKIELCAGTREYELEPEEEITIDVEDEDCVYLDTFIKR